MNNLGNGTMLVLVASFECRQVFPRLLTLFTFKLRIVSPGRTAQCADLHKVKR